MYELRAVRIERAKVEPLQQCELLQEHRPLAPWTAFQHGVVVIVVRQRLFDRRRPGGEIIRA